MGLSDLLMGEGLAGADDLRRARARARSSQVPLSAALVDERVVAEDVLAEAVARAVGTVVIDVEQGELDRESVALVPEVTARRYLVIPVAQDPSRECVRVAFADPLDAGAVDVVRDLTGLGVEPLVATVSGIRRAIEREYGRRPRRGNTRGSGEMPTEITRRMQTPIGQPEGAASDAPPGQGTAPLHRIEHEATMEQRHEALLLSLVEKGVLTRADYLEALRRFLGKDG